MSFSFFSCPGKGCIKRLPGYQLPRDTAAIPWKAPGCAARTAGRGGSARKVFQKINPSRMGRVEKNGNGRQKPLNHDQYRGDKTSDRAFASS